MKIRVFRFHPLAPLVAALVLVALHPNMALMTTTPLSETASSSDLTATVLDTIVQEESAEGEKVASTTSDQGSTESAPAGATETVETTVAPELEIGAETSASEMPETGNPWGIHEGGWLADETRKYDWEVDTNAVDETEADEEDMEIEEPEVAEGVSRITSRPPLSVRLFNRRVTQNVDAVHACEAETFRIELSGKTSAEARIRLTPDTGERYELEIGGLPNGIEVAFASSGGPTYVQGAGDQYVMLTITNQPNSQKGNFSIPIMYVRKNGAHSTVVCQLNLINQ